MKVAASTAAQGSDNLIARLIGDAAVIALAEAFGGTRLYIPGRMKPEHPIARAVGIEAATVLCDRHGSETIRVPLAREMRAVHYRQSGLSNARIAARLGLTEGGVGNLFKRLDGRG